MTVAAELKRPSTSGALKRAIERMVAQGRISQESQEKIHAINGYLPKPGAEIEAAAQPAEIPKRALIAAVTGLRGAAVAALRPYQTHEHEKTEHQ